MHIPQYEYSGITGGQTYAFISTGTTSGMTFSYPNEIRYRLIPDSQSVL
jgi:hypothetical protein